MGSARVGQIDVVVAGMIPVANVEAKVRHAAVPVAPQQFDPDNSHLFARLRLERLRLGELIGLLGGLGDPQSRAQRQTQQGRRVGNRRPCNRWACGALRSRAKRSLCDALPSVAMTMTGRACLAAPYDVHDCPSQFVGQRSIRPSKASPTGDDVEFQNAQFAQFIL